MESSQKIKLSKIIVLAWIVIAVAFIALFSNSFSKYSKYKKAQETAVELTTAVLTQFDSSKDDYEELVHRIYRYFNYNMTSRALGIEMDKTLGELMSASGYPCTYGSDYLKYVGFVDYTKNTGGLRPWTAMGIVALAMLIISLWYALDSKNSLVISNDRILCCKGEKTVKEFFIKDIKSVEITAIKGLAIKGNSIKYRINLLKNADSMKQTIMERLYALPAESISIASQTTQQSSADELKKLKELVELGVISQEEFDAKKKQLLGI